MAISQVCYKLKSTLNFLSITQTMDGGTGSWRPHTTVTHPSLQPTPIHSCRVYACLCAVLRARPIVARYRVLSNIHIRVHCIRARRNGRPTTRWTGNGGVIDVCVTLAII